MALTPKAFAVLVALVERPGVLVEKTELLKLVWPDVSVEEGNLTVTISQLRRSLGDDRGKHEYIETVSKYGYRFVAPVTRSIAPRADAAPLQAGEAGPATPVSVPSDTKSEDFEVIVPAGISGIGSLPRLQQVVSRRVTGWILSGAISLCALVLAGRFWILKTEARAVVPEATSMHSLAVLPFRMIGVRKGDEFWGEGAADALVTKLGNIESIVVRPIRDTERYQSGAITPVEIGRKEDVDGVLDGLIQREGDRVRLTVRLVRVRDGSELWADVFDEKFSDIFALEDRVSDRVVQSLQIKLTNANAKRISRKLTENASAYESYVKGRYFWNKRTNDGLQKGLQYFREAIRLDPNFAGAYEGVADSYAALGLYAVLAPNDAFPAARQAARKALEMDDNLADAHATLGMIHFYYDWDALAAENEFRRALQINPNYAMAHSWNAESLAAMGRFAEAVDEAKLALKDDPLSQIVNSNAGWTMCLAGQNDAAIEILTNAIEMDPNFPRTHFRLGMVYQSKGMQEQAIQEFQKATELSDRNPVYEASMANALAASGRVKEVAPILQSLRLRSAKQHVPAFAFALIYAGLHDKDSAFKWLDKTAADHSASMVFARVDPEFASLRSDSRFAALLNNLKF